MAIELITGRAGTAHVDSSDIGEFNAYAFGSGIYILNGCAATVSSVNGVKIGAGNVLAEGRHFRIIGTGEKLDIDNGQNNYKRIDVVAAHYTRNASGIESVALVLVKGTPTTVTPAQPAMPNSGKVLDGATEAYWPLYAITIDGLTPQTPVKLAGDNPLITTGGGSAVPVSKGGTGATTVAGALASLGLGDHVRASGTTNGWEWIKYDNGLAICARSEIGSRLAVNIPWGSVYYCGIEVCANAYPFDFVSLPKVIQYCSSGSCWLAGGTAGNTHKSSGAWLCSMSSATATVNIHQFVIGRYE